MAKEIKDTISRKKDMEMSEPTDDKRLAEIEERAAKATSGPWEDLDGEIEYVCNMVRNGNVNTIARTGEYYSHADAAFIAHSRQDIPYLLNEIRKLREGKATLRYTNKCLLEEIEILRSNQPIDSQQSSSSHLQQQAHSLTQ